MEVSPSDWEQLEKQLQVDGKPGNIIQLGRHIEALLCECLDMSNASEIANARLLLSLLSNAL